MPFANAPSISADRETSTVNCDSRSRYDFNFYGDRGQARPLSLTVAQGCVVREAR